jgi:large subunit ribosomal protein L15
MTLTLGNLAPRKGAIKKRKRVGRGPGSGHGKTSTRGHKGQKARNKVSPWFEGGQMPLQRRVPKRGFRNTEHKVFQVVNVGDLTRVGGAGPITPARLAESGLIRDAARAVKILGDGELAAGVEVQAQAFSKSAREKIEARGGTVTWLNEAGAVIAPPKPKRIYRPKPVPKQDADDAAAPAKDKEKGKEKGKAEGKAKPKEGAKDAGKAGAPKAKGEAKPKGEKSDKG